MGSGRERIYTYDGNKPTLINSYIQAYRLPAKARLEKQMFLVRISIQKRAGGRFFCYFRLLYYF